MVIWASLTIALFLMPVLIAWRGGRHDYKPGAVEHLAGLAFLFGVVGWVAWVLIGCVTIILFGVHLL